MGKLSIKDNFSFAPAKESLYLVVMDEFPSALIVGGEFPYVAYEAYTQLDANSVKYFPGSNDVEDVQLEVFETTQNHVWDFFLSWSNQMVAADGYYNVPAAYKRTVKVFRLNSDLTEAFGLEYTGCWPKTISSYAPKSDGQDALRYSINLSCDAVAPLAIRPVANEANIVAESRDEHRVDEEKWLQKLNGGIVDIRNRYRDIRMEWLLKKNDVEIAPSVYRSKFRL